MGKPTGFLEYTRIDRPVVSPEERLSSCMEFRGKLSPLQRRDQAARCMNCGVPFCQSEYGCPLHNLIPEWNDEVYAENMAYALRRLLKTNNFPEFTGRVCPALCENACTCSLNGEAVTIRDNELSIIEAAWTSGMMAPSPPSFRTGKQVAVIGSGPSGLAVAEQLNRRGHNVTVFERDDRPGGLLMYGIPNMKLDKDVIRRRVEKMAAEGIVFSCGTEIGKDISGEELRSEYDAVILCCGARATRPLGVDTEGVSGVLTALDYLTAATKAVLKGSASEYSAKGRNVIIVGNGDTATDCVATALRQGAASVRQLVRKPRPENTARIWPYPFRGEKVEYGQEEAIAVFGSDPRMYGTTVKEVHADENGALHSVVVKGSDGEQELPAELLLAATGFSGAEPAVAATFGLALDDRGHLGGSGFCTDDPKVFACGDVRRGSSLVVWAIAEGRACARVVDKALEGYTNL